MYNWYMGQIRYFCHALAFLVFAPSLALWPKESNATSILFCRRFNYKEVFSVRDAPPGISVASQQGGYSGSFLKNTSSVPLMYRRKSGKCIRLVNSKVFEWPSQRCLDAAASETERWREAKSDVRILIHTNLGNMAENRTIPILENYSSDTKKPPQPKSFQFELPVLLGGEKQILTVVGDYEFFEQKCK